MRYFSYALGRLFVIAVFLVIFVNVGIGVYRHFYHPNTLQTITQTSTSVVDDSLLRIKQSNELRVGVLKKESRMFVDFYHLNQLSGFEFDVLKQFANSLKVNLTVILADNVSDLIDLQQNNKIDFIASIITGAPIEDQENYAATKPYHYIHQQLIYKDKNKKPAHLGDLIGNLAVPEYSLQSHLLQQSKQKYPQLSWNESTLNEENLIRKIANGELDYSISDKKTIDLMRRLYPDLKIAFDIASHYPESWYFLKEDISLFNVANQFIQNAQQDGSLSKLEATYSASSNISNFVDSKSFMTAIEKKLPNYIDDFKKYGAEYNIDWRMLAAMAYQESHWNAHAVSPTGVRGLMMLTQVTAVAMGISDRLDPEESIRGGAKYISLLLNKISDQVPEQDRILFALAAYNMGYAHLLDAKRLAAILEKNHTNWSDLKTILPLLANDEHSNHLRYGKAKSQQALAYVENIQRYYVYLVTYFNEDEPKNTFTSPYEENETKTTS